METCPLITGLNPKHQLLFDKITKISEDVK